MACITASLTVEILCSNNNSEYPMHRFVIFLLSSVYGLEFSLTTCSTKLHLNSFQLDLSIALSQASVVQRELIALASG